MTLEEFLRKHVNGRFSLKVSGIDPRWMKIYIHPDGEDGETLDFYVFDDRLVSCDDFEAFGAPVPAGWGVIEGDDDNKLSAEEMLRCGIQEMS
jgi:hypothetical protein